MKTYLPKILITGCNGQMGHALCSSKLTANFDVHAYSRAQLDITDILAVKHAIEQIKPDIVVNTAAYTAVDKAEQEKEACLRINYHAAKNLAHACQQNHVVLMHLSTDYVFAGNTEKPYLENDIAAPINMYGQSKYQGEQAIRENCEKHIILRVSGIFSAHGNNFLLTMLRLAREKKMLRVVADQVTCPTFADDIASTLFKIAGNVSSFGTYHFCNSPQTSWHQFASAIIKQASQREKFSVDEITAITTADYLTDAARPAYSVLDCSKIKRDYDIEQTHWLTGIRKALSK